VHVFEDLVARNRIERPLSESGIFDGTFDHVDACSASMRQGIRIHVQPRHLPALRLRAEQELAIATPDVKESVAAWARRMEMASVVVPFLPQWGRQQMHQRVAQGMGWLKPIPVLSIEEAISDADAKAGRGGSVWRYRWTVRLVALVRELDRGFSRPRVQVS
jgi:hypothetical protein